MKAFIESNFRILDINGDGIVGIEEFRYNCITRMAIDNVTPIDEAFDALLTVSLSCCEIKSYILFKFCVIFVMNVCLDIDRMLIVRLVV